MRKFVLVVALGIFLASGALAAEPGLSMRHGRGPGMRGIVRPVQLSLTPRLALYHRGVRIEGLSLGVWSENPQTALSLGVVSGSTGNSSGFSYSLLVNYADNYRGVHWAPANLTDNEFVGWQAGIVNYTAGEMRGLQTGTFNYAGRLTGLQWGIVNYAEFVESGAQVGLVNLIPRNALFKKFPREVAPGMVFVNWKF